MTKTATVEPNPAVRPRKVAHSTRGHNGGIITRLMSPGDLGETLKPFVFLDLADTGDQMIRGRNMHPHSGIATVTYVFEGSTRFEDTTGASGILPAGGVEWFKAGRGAWHGGGYRARVELDDFEERVGARLQSGSTLVTVRSQQGRLDFS